MVRRIYREYLEGYSMKSIALHLEQDGILTGAGNTKWYDSTINKILRNEKYMGDALLQKTVTTDFLTKKRVKNNGVLPQYYVEDDHEAIIPSIGSTAGFTTLWVCPALSLIVSDKKYKRRAIVEVYFSLILVIALLCQIHIFLIVVEGTEFTNLFKAPQCIEHQNPLGLFIDRSWRPAPSLQNLLYLFFLHRLLGELPYCYPLPGNVHKIHRSLLLCFY